MTAFSKARLALYLTMLLGFIAMVLSALGIADYDPATRMIDIRPVSIDAIVAFIVGPSAGLATAAVAVIRGWGGAKRF